MNEAVSASIAQVRRLVGRRLRDDARVVDAARRTPARQCGIQDMTIHAPVGSGTAVAAHPRILSPQHFRPTLTTGLRAPKSVRISCHAKASPAPGGTRAGALREHHFLLRERHATGIFLRRHSAAILLLSSFLSGPPRTRKM